MEFPCKIHGASTEEYQSPQFGRSKSQINFLSLCRLQLIYWGAIFALLPLAASLEYSWSVFIHSFIKLVKYSDKTQLRLILGLYSSLCNHIVEFPFHRRPSAPCSRALNHMGSWRAKYKLFAKYKFVFAFKLFQFVTKWTNRASTCCRNLLATAFRWKCWSVSIAHSLTEHLALSCFEVTANWGNKDLNWSFNDVSLLSREAPKLFAMRLDGDSSSSWFVLI